MKDNYQAICDFNLGYEEWKDYITLVFNQRFDFIQSFSEVIEQLTTLLYILEPY